MAPHAAYMKITTLELEKLRLSKAREHALHRIGEIDAPAARTGGAKDRVAQLPGAGTQRAGQRRRRQGAAPRTAAGYGLPTETEMFPKRG